MAKYKDKSMINNQEFDPDYCFNCKKPLLYQNMPCTKCGFSNLDRSIKTYTQINKQQNINEASNLKPCVYCGEDILVNAVKCKHCGEFLNNPLSSDSNSVPNNSGQGKSTVVPDSIKKWNWGAFFMGWIWGIGNKGYSTLPTIIPFFMSFNMSGEPNILYLLGIWYFLCGAKGNEWSWKANQWKSIDHFHSVQKVWAIWGLVYVVVSTFIALAISSQSSQ